MKYKQGRRMFLDFLNERQEGLSESEFHCSTSNMYSVKRTKTFSEVILDSVHITKFAKSAFTENS